MTLSFCSASDIAAMIDERHFYNQLPELAILEIPVPILLNLNYRASNVKADFGFVLEDLVEDCINRTVVKDASSESLEEWFDDISQDLIAEDWFHDSAIEYMNAVGELFDNLKAQVGMLYTPSGHHYYEFTDWVDRGHTTLLLTKRRYVE